ncbi:hypothetical protein GW17_00026614 [Ensete ventricosum]|uniref:Uncharacterized protein n=1 Tax=Ensete ventricosum TaxID=4639 RepID=A0A444EHN5_ENSVE|nr:hypothetical protein GW17_00026614 [Ensete ventricosum]RZR71570.1 hypothetical protein BHM03_00005911 [Ensete ventricosum]
MADGFTGDMAGGDRRMKSQQGIILCYFETGDMVSGFMGAVGQWRGLRQKDLREKDLTRLDGAIRARPESVQWEGDALGIIGSMILSLLRGWVAAMDRGQLGQPGMNTTNNERTRIFKSSKEKQRSWLQKRSRLATSASHAARRGGDLLPFDSEKKACE